jgi:putative transposase
MNRTYKYRIYGNKQTIANAEKWLELCRVLYNCALAERIYAYEMFGITLSYIDQQKELPDLRKEFPEYCSINSHTLRDVIGRVNSGYYKFFVGIKNGQKVGLPRFKGKGRYSSFTLIDNGCKLDGNYLYVNKVGKFKIKMSRKIEGDIKYVNIKRTNTGKWFACFNCDNVGKKNIQVGSGEVGIDVGIESFLTTSDGKKIDNNRYFAKSKDKLALRQRRLSRRIKGSNRRKKARTLVAKTYEKIADQRRDFHFKTARYLIKNYNKIYIEDMEVWKSNRSLNREMRDVAWFGFFDILSFEVEETSCSVIKVPAKNTSRICSACNAINNELTLSDRTWICMNCGALHDRDINAANNILRLGQSLQISESENPFMRDVNVV